MRIETVHVRGAVGFRNGLGLDEVFLDFRDKKGLIALSGNNGLGKSTLMEMMLPFRSVPNRESGFAGAFFLKDSFKDVAYDMGDRKVRLLVRVNADNGRAEAFAWEDGVPMVDGKLREFDAYVERIFGEENLFFQSVFAAQKGQSLAELKPAAAKDLFGQVVNLDTWKAWEQTAKAAAGICNAAIRDGEAELSKALVVQESLDSLMEKNRSDRAYLAHLETATSGAAEEILLLETSLKTLEEERIAQTRKEAELFALQEKAHALANEAQKNLSEKETRVRDMEARHAAIQKRQEKAAAVASGKGKAELAAKDVTRLEAELLGDENALSGLEGEIEECRASLESEREALLEIRETWDDLLEDPDLQAATGDHADLQAEIQGLEQSLKDLKQQADTGIRLYQKSLQDLERRETILSQRPYTCDIDICPFIADAKAASQEKAVLQAENSEASAEIQNRIAETEQILLHTKTLLASCKADYDACMESIKAKEAGLKAEYARHEARIRILEEERKTLTAKQASIRRSIQGNRAALDAARKDAETLPIIREAGLQWLDLETERLGLSRELTDLYAAMEQERGVFDREHRRLLSSADSLTSEISPDLQARIREAAEKLNRLRETRISIERDKAAMEQAIVIDDLRLKERDAVLENVSQITSHLVRCREELARWVYLQKACSRNGIPTLEIDGLAPTVCAFANRLLSSTHPGWSVDIQTLDPATGKEVFDFVAIREDGQRTSFGNVSGGEGVWLMNATRLGFTCTAKELSGRAIHTAFCDETDKGLHVSRLDQFLTQIREFMRIGGFATTFLITHNEAVWSRCDHIVQFAPGGIRFAA